jgi:hypothetical protein
MLHPSHVLHVCTRSGARSERDSFELYFVTLISPLIGQWVNKLKSRMTNGPALQSSPSSIAERWIF